MYRHASNSGFANLSRFAEGTGARHIQGLVDHALRYGRQTGTGTFEHSFGRAVRDELRRRSRTRHPGSQMRREHPDSLTDYHSLSYERSTTQSVHQGGLRPARSICFTDYHQSLGRHRSAKAFYRTNFTPPPSFGIAERLGTMFFQVPRLIGLC